MSDQALQRPVSCNAPQLVVTLGPASFGMEAQLVQAGATALRLNASHMAAELVAEHCQNIASRFDSTACIVDLQGAKMRLGDNAPRQVLRGETLRLSPEVTAEGSLHVPHPELFEQARVGEQLGVDDGRLFLLILDATRTSLNVRADRDYLILPRKGINRQSHPIVIEDLSPKDQEIVTRCARIPRVHFAVSFVVDGREASWVRARAPNAEVTLKVERREALERLETLAQAADSLWICRGDLGAQLGLFELGSAVAQIAPARLPVPVLMAGQVLEHLTAHAEPTRSELCHFHDLLARRYSGVVLSDETALGVDPALATQWARRLLPATGPATAGD